MGRFSERTVLYVSVDGILDVLGQSQILAYLQGLTRYGWRFVLVTLEKVRTWEACFLLRQQLRAQGIDWFPLLYRGAPRVVNAPVEIGVLRDVLVALIRRFRPALIHVRGTHPGLPVLKALRQVGGASPLLLYDMRQFWADQRRESGVWDVRRPHHLYYYLRAKWVEKAMIERARATVVLTDWAKHLLGLWRRLGWLRRVGSVFVIPCGVPASLIPSGLSARRCARVRLGLALNRKYVGVVGGWAPWYDWRAIGQFLRQLVERDPETDVCLWVWGVDLKRVWGWAYAQGLPAARVVVGRFRWREVLSLLPGLDAGVLFLRGRIGVVGASPVKVSEWLLAGVPVIANVLGDLPTLLLRIQGVPVVVRTDELGIGRWLDRWMGVVFRKRREESMVIRQRAMSIFSTERVVERYHRVYTLLLG